MAKSVDIISSQWIRPIEKVTVTDAVLSVYDKSGITELGSFLASKGVTLMSTGGTRKILLEKGLEVSEVSEYTNSPELLGGRVKTLHPKIYAGLLARRGDDSHVQECSDASVKMLNLVVVNLYPFRKAVSFDWKDAMCDKGEGLGSEEDVST